MRELKRSRNRSLGMFSEAGNRSGSNSILSVIKNIDRDLLQGLSVNNRSNFGAYWRKAVSLADDYFDILDSIRDLESRDRDKVMYAKNNIAGWLLSIYNWKKDRAGFNKFKDYWYKDSWSDEDVSELKQVLSVFDPIFDFLKRNVTISGRDSLSDINNIKAII